MPLNDGKTEETPLTPPAPEPPAPAAPQAFVEPLPTPVKQPRFNSTRFYMRNGATFKIMFVTMVADIDGYNHYTGADGLPLCSIKREDAVAFVNLDVPEETVQSEKGPVKAFPAGITISTGYQF